MNYEYRQHAIEVTHSFKKWFDTSVAPIVRSSDLRQLENWEREIEGIRALVEDLNRLRIALVGTTGAGKSTFLNAVLGQEVLPVGVMQPCTSFVTSVSYLEGNDYKISVHFCSKEEWSKDFENFIESLTPGDTEDLNSGHADTKKIIETSWKRVQAVYGIQRDAERDPEQLRAMRLPDQIQNLFSHGALEENQFHQAKEMLDYLRKLIRGDGAFWPLIKEVKISGPYKCLAGGLELVDLPGLNDPNEARVDVTRGYLRTSPYVWVVFPMVRGLTDDIQKILREERLLRTLVLSGNYEALSLIGTKADDIDTNIANQLGLPDDCTIPELVKTYCDQTVEKSRQQLEEIVRDLNFSEGEQQTFNRMISMAQNVRVHTTSASAYNKIKGIGRLRRDYGIDDEKKTGIPLVHEHLEEIGRGAGAAYNAKNALMRISKLRDEISFFFRAKAQATSAKVEEARSRYQEEKRSFSSKIRQAKTQANDQLKLHREIFLQNIEPLLSRSVQGVKREIEVWSGIHWATLRAIVQRDGVFRSPSTGRSYDFNEDIANPILSKLPVKWEKYFTDDIDRISSELVIRITESGTHFCEKIELITDLLFQKSEQQVEKQLDWFKDKVSLQAQSAQGHVRGIVRERRSELANKMPLVAREYMLPAYQLAKEERGRGMKNRILNHLGTKAINSASPIYQTIQTDLVEGLEDLEVVIVGMFRRLVSEAESQAEIVASNANIGIDENVIDPVVTEIIESIPMDILNIELTLEEQ